MFSKKHWTFSKIPRDVFLKNNGMFFDTFYPYFDMHNLHFPWNGVPLKQCFNSVLMPFKHGVIITEKLRFPIVSFPLQAPQSP